MMRQISLSLVDTHKKKIIHGSIQPRNFAFEVEKNYSSLKLFNFQYAIWPKRNDNDDNELAKIIPNTKSNSQGMKFRMLVFDK